VAARLREILYPENLIKKTCQDLFFDIEATTPDQVIERVDVSRAYDKLPNQYQRAIFSWLDAENTTEFGKNWIAVGMSLHTDEHEARVICAAAWRYLGDLLNVD
jgi:hypothetical protein